MGETTIPETFVVETPEQLKALAEPLRQRLLECFAAPATIKQAAARLGEPLTKLYHHVDQLLAAGLIRIASEQRRRAVVERSFVVAGRRLSVSPAAFGADQGRARKRDRIARANLEELLAGAALGEGAFRLLRTRVRLGAAGRERLEIELARLLEKLDEPNAPEIDLMMLSARRR
jgi:helix-turn-helix protein